MEHKDKMLIFIALVLCISLVGLSSISASDISTNQSADSNNLIITDSNIDNSNVDEVNILDDSSELNSVDTVYNTLDITSKSLKTEDGDSIILTDDNYDQYFTDNVYNSEITNITLGSDIKNKDFIFNTVVTVSNDDNYTIYNSTITLNNNTTFNGLKVNTAGKETVFFINAGNIILNNSVIYHENNGLIKTFIINDANILVFNYCNITVKGDDISFLKAENINDFNTTYLNLNITGNKGSVFKLENGINVNFNYDDFNVKGDVVSVIELNNVTKFDTGGGIYTITGNNVSFLKQKNGNYTSVHSYVNINATGVVSVVELDNVCEFYIGGPTFNVNGTNVSVVKHINGNKTYTGGFSAYINATDVINVFNLDNVTTVNNGGNYFYLNATNVSFLKYENGNYSISAGQNLYVNAKNVTNVFDLNNVTTFNIQYNNFNVNGTNVSFLKQVNGNKSFLYSFNLNITGDVVSVYDLDNLTNIDDGGTYYNITGNNVSFLKHTNGNLTQFQSYSINITGTEIVSVYDLDNVTKLDLAGTYYNITGSNVSFLKHTNGNESFSGGCNLNITCDIFSAFDINNITNIELASCKYNITCENVSFLKHVNGNSSKISAGIIINSTNTVSVFDLEDVNTFITGGYEDNITGSNVSFLKHVNGNSTEIGGYTLNIIGDDVSVIDLENINYSWFYSNRFNITANNISLINGNSNFTDISYNNINLTGENLSGINLSDINNSLISNNTFKVNTTDTTKPVIVLSNASNTEVVNNTFKGTTELPFVFNDSENITYNPNYFNIVLTDDNYYKFFDEDGVLKYYYVNISLGSDIYNKDFIFNYPVNFTNMKNIGYYTFIGNTYEYYYITQNFTIYNSTITLNENSTSTLESIRLVNTDDRSTSLIIRNNNSYVSGLNLTQVNTDNDTKAIIFENILKTYNNRLSSMFLYGYINITSNSGSIFVLDNATAQFYLYPTVVARGNNLSYVNIVNTNWSEIRGGTLYLKNNISVPVINIENSSNISYTYNYLYLLNNSYVNNSVVSLLNSSSINVTYNYIYTKDVYGNNAVNITGNNIIVINNYPTSYQNVSYPITVTLDHEGERILYYGNNTVRFNITDIFGDPIENGNVSITVNWVNSYYQNESFITSQTVSIFKGTATFNINIYTNYSSLIRISGSANSGITYTYFNYYFMYVMYLTNVEVQPMNSLITDNITIIASVKNNETGEYINQGNVSILINGKMLRDDDGNIIQVPIENYVVKYTYNTTFKNVNVIVQYNGIPGIFNKSTSPTVRTNLSLIQTITELNPITAKVGDNVTITAVVRDINGNKVTGGKVAFKVNGKTIGYGVVKNGVATINYTSGSVKVNNISAIYSGNSLHNSSLSNNATLTFNKRVVDISLSMLKSSISMGEVDTFTVRVSDGGKSVTGGKVVFKLNGKTLTDADGNVIYVNVVNGVASLNYSISELTAGDYNLSVVYSNGVYERAETSSTLTINKIVTHVELDNITTTKNNTQTVITARIYNNNINTLISGSNKVTIKLNGVTVKQTTAVNGVVNTTIDTSQYKNSQYTITIISGDTKTYLSSTTTATLTIEK